MRYSWIYATKGPEIQVSQRAVRGRKPALFAGCEIGKISLRLGCFRHEGIHIGLDEILEHFEGLDDPRSDINQRSHWGIENRLHWMLDVEFAEDASRIRKGASPQIASMLRQLALMVLQQDTSLKEKTIRGKRKIAGWSNDALDALLRSAQAL